MDIRYIRLGRKKLVEQIIKFRNFFPGRGHLIHPKLITADLGHGAGHFDDDRIIVLIRSIFCFIKPERSDRRQSVLNPELI